jgi:hypothetical protein
MNDWSAVLSLVGVAFGWGLTQASTLLATRQADKKVLKEVLYFLLELHRLLSALERMNTQLPSMLATLKRYASTPPPELQSDLDALIERFLRAGIAPIIGEQLAGLKDGYNASLLKLATVDPVNAYRLRGQDAIIQKVPQVLAALQTAAATHLDATTPLPPEVQAFFHQHLEARDIRETTALVREIAEQHAQQLGRRTKKQVDAVFAKHRQKELDLQTEFNDWMQQAAAHFSS